VGVPAGGPMGRVGANSNLVRGQVVPAPPSIVGQKGSYSVVGASAGRGTYGVNRIPANNNARLGVNVPRPVTSVPRSYGYAGSSSVPHPSGAPIRAVPSSPPVSAMPHVSAPSSAPHVSSASVGGGGGFHGGGGGGGGSHGGGGGHR